MKKFKLLRKANDRQGISFETDEEVASFNIIDGILRLTLFWNKFKAYPLIRTDYPLPFPLPQRISLNEMEVGDIIQHDVFKNYLLIRTY